MSQVARQVGADVPAVPIEQPVATRAPEPEEATTGRRPGAPPSITDLAPHAGAPNPPAPQASSDVAGAASVLEAFSPEVLLAAMQIRVRDAGASIYGESIEGAQSRGELAELERQHAVELAEKAANKSSGLLGLKGPLAKLVRAVAIVASVAASVTSGGAAAGVGMAGLALSLGGGQLANGLHRLGLVDEDKVGKLGMALQLAGGLLATGGGVAAAADPETIGGAIETIRRVLTVVQSAGEGVDGALSIGLAVLDRRHAEHLADADRAQTESDAAHETMDELLEELRELFEAFARIRQRLQSAIEAKEEARRAASQLPA